MANIRALFFKLFLFLLLMLGNGISPAQNIVTIPQEKQAEIERFLELAQRYKQAGNLQQTIFYLNKVAFIYWEHGALREAVNYFLESVPLNEKVQNLNDIKAIYSNIGLIYTDLDRLDLALEYFNKSLEVRRKLNNKADIAAGLIDVAYLLTVQNQFEKAIPLLEEAYQLSQKVGNPRLTLNCLRLLANCYERIGNTKKALEYNNLFASVEQHLATQQVKVEYEEIVGKTQVQAEKERMERMAKQLELEYQKLMSKAKEDSLGFVVKAKQDSLFQAEQVARQQQIEIDLINKDRELKEVQISEQQARERTQKMIIYSISIFLLLLTLLAIVVYKNYKDKKRANVKLSEQNYEIQRQKDQIQRQNENITKSINYAQGIQKALLPAQNYLQEFLPDSFIFFKPRDVVSGDYYWFRPIILNGSDIYNPAEDKFAISAIDCTGHGVPGAFLSMIGYNLLDEIVEKGIHNPADVLLELNKGIRRTLRQDETDNRDGMDMALCIINKAENTVEFAGAKNPVVYVTNGEANRIRGDKDSIGGGTENLQNVKFTTHKIKVESPTWFYIFSDGFIDQFGGAEGRKYMIKNFTELLVNLHSLPSAEQREKLKMEMKNWMGDTYPQVDDVLVIGFKVEP